MTKSLLLTLDETIVEAIEQALINQGLRTQLMGKGVWLNRQEPAGENDPLPIVIVDTGETKESIDEAHTISTHIRKIVVSIYVNLADGQEVSAALDPIHQCVRTAILSAGRTVQGVNRLLQPAMAMQPQAKGILGEGQYVYTVHQTTYQLDLGATPDP